MRRLGTILIALIATAVSPAAPPPPDLAAQLSYPFVDVPAASRDGSRIAWITNVRGVRSVWTAAAAGGAPRRVWTSGADDGQELTSLALAPDGRSLAWVRGGDHDANWPAEGGLQPNPASAAAQPQMEIWFARADGPAAKLADGDAPAVSATGRVAFLHDGAVWTADPAGKAKPERLFFDRGKDADLAWSPDGRRLAFTSTRGDHAFIGVYTDGQPIVWLAPATGRDGAPVWSPDGRRIAFTRGQGTGGAPEPMLREVPHPWSIWVADAATGEGRAAWNSPRDLAGSFPEVPGGVFLRWAAGDRLLFRAEMDGWPHLYALPAAGGAPVLLTPGAYMVERPALTVDGRSVLFDANTGAASGDDDRRHLMRVSLDRPGAVALTRGEGIETGAVPFGPSRIAYVAAGAETLPSLRTAGLDGEGQRALDGGPPAYAGRLVTPRPVTWTAPDGLLIHGQLFGADDGARARKPAIIFVHGGPPRQMLLGWSYMDYYSHAYAMNQWYATHGYVVLSVNYRLGIGYGRAFQHPAAGGAAGSSEYQDVLAGARYLQKQPGVDPARIGIWGGSYGGLLTALALARDSDVFRAGVDLHGVHDWSRLMSEEAQPPKRYEQGDWDRALKVAFESSPVAAVDRWKSPVLLIHGDDDRNVRFNQTIDLARRLEARGVPYQELVLPDEIHGFLRWGDWLKADAAAIAFFGRELRP